MSLHFQFASGASVTYAGLTFNAFNHVSPVLKSAKQSLKLASYLSLSPCCMYEFQ